MRLIGREHRGDHVYGGDEASIIQYGRMLQPPRTDLYQR